MICETPVLELAEYPKPDGTRRNLQCIDSIGRDVKLKDCFPISYCRDTSGNFVFEVEYSKATVSEDLKLISGPLSRTYRARIFLPSCLEDGSRLDWESRLREWVERAIKVRSGTL